MKKKLALKRETIRTLTDLRGIVGGLAVTVGPETTNSGTGLSLIYGCPSPSDDRCNLPSQPNVCPMGNASFQC